MNTIQDRSKTPMEKVHNIDGNTKSAHAHENSTESVPTDNKAERLVNRTTDLLEEAYDDWVKNAIELNRLEVQKHRAAKGCVVPVPNKTINLLEHDDLVATAGELIRLQAQIHRAREKNYDLQTLTQQETHYAAMKQEFDSALKKAQTRQQ